MKYNFNTESGIFVDLGASFFGSSPLPTTQMLKSSKQSLLIECNPGKYQSAKSSTELYANITVTNSRVTPSNILIILEHHLDLVNNEIDLLKIDIDGYDYYVLDSILQEHRPKVIHCEFNEKIPPPIVFSVLYDAHYAWDSSHFYGMSLSGVHELCLKYGYKLLEVDAQHTSVFIGRSDLHSELPELLPEDLYDIDRVMKLSYNRDTMHFHNKSSAEAIIEIDKFFSEHVGRYRIE